MGSRCSRCPGKPGPSTLSTAHEARPNPRNIWVVGWVTGSKEALTDTHPPTAATSPSAAANPGVPKTV